MTQKIIFQARCRSCGYLLLSLFILMLSLFPSLQAQEHSKLWGKNGEVWKPDRSLLKLLNFTEVGYKHGNVPIPVFRIGVNVKDFGAIGDGVHDDTQAFKNAIAACPENSAVFVPIGRYTITDQIRIERNNIVIRGEDMYRSVIWFPKYLTESGDMLKELYYQAMRSTNIIPG